MEQMTIRLAEERDLRPAAALLFPSAATTLMKEGRIWLAYLGTSLCGALGALEKEDTLYVSSLFVAQEARRMGVGSALVREAEDWAKSQDFFAIEFAYHCTSEDVLQMDAFFEKNGYPLPLAGNVMFTVSLADLQKSSLSTLLAAAKPSPHIVPLWQIEKHLLTKVPAFLRLDEAAGKPLPELCLAYVHRNRLTAMIILTDTDGILHLNSVYLAEKIYAAHLMSLLRQAMDTLREQYPYFQTITVTGGTKSGYALMEKLLADVPLERCTVYRAKKELDDLQPDFMPIQHAAALVRLESFAEKLAQCGVGSALSLMDGAPPYLEAYFEEDTFTLAYAITEENELFFTLWIEYAFPPLEHTQRDRILAQLTAENTPYFGLLSETGNLLMRGSLAEGRDADGFDVEQSIHTLILPFRAYLQNLTRASA